MKQKRVLLVSCSVILLCICIIVGMTYALFTDSVSVMNHLKAGNLDITLTRTNLEYSVLNEDGELAVTKIEDDIDFTTRLDENVFGIGSSDMRIAPGSYFDADMLITNDGNVAFDYNVGIEFMSGSEIFADQLLITVTHPDGTVTEKKLIEFSSEISIAAGKMKVNDASQSFSVRVDFIDDNDVNNYAQNKAVVFDLVVTAIQATSQD